MSIPALAQAPVLVDDRPGIGLQTLDAELLERASRDDYQRWLGTAVAAGGCVRPIRLRGTVRDIDATTGEGTGAPRSARPAPRPTAPTPTSSSGPGSQAAKACPNRSPLTRACSPPS